ncbi:uncharacterized protein VP01_2264g1 [Puccinia sorghi]|uniref:UBC core domain-containing protein n=1 Tax=Puccinia sorghi TaxID=27349 RepID=A0A0L6V900_9BASI|nr:uncharacterized protein VP01_2264g1 [Puccinia sorghi]
MGCECVHVGVWHTIYRTSRASRSSPHNQLQPYILVNTNVSEPKNCQGKSDSRSLPSKKKQKLFFTIQEYTDLQANPIDNVTIEPDENNVLHWTGSFFFFEIIWNCRNYGGTSWFVLRGRKVQDRSDVSAGVSIQSTSNQIFNKDISPQYHTRRAPLYRSLKTRRLETLDQDRTRSVLPSYFPIGLFMLAIVNLLVEPNPEDAIVASIAEQFGKDYNLFKATAQEYVRKVSGFFFKLGKKIMFVLMIVLPSPPGSSMRAERLVSSTYLYTCNLSGC